MTRRRRSPAAWDLDLANLVDWFGTGLWFTALGPYLRRRTGFEAGDVALWLGVLGVFGLAVVIPGSRVAARRGGRPVAVALHLARGALFLPLLVVDATPFLFATAVAVLTLDRTATGVLQVLVGQELPVEQRVAAMARLHAVANIGIAAGSAVGGIALQQADEGRLALVLALDAATFVLAGVVLAVGGRVRAAATATAAVDADADADAVDADGVEPAEPGRAGAGAPAGERVAAGATGERERRPALPRMAPLAVLGLANCLLALHIPLLNVVVPLLVDDRPDLSLSLVGAAFVLNTVLVVALQVPLGRGVAGLAAGNRRLRWGAAALGGSALGLGVVAAGASPAVAVAAGAAAVVLVTLAEIWRGVGAWAVSYAFDEASGRDGRAIGAFALGPAAAGLVGPALVGPLVLDGGGPGAVVLAVVVGAAGLAFATRRPATLVPAAGV